MSRWSEGHSGPHLRRLAHRALLLFLAGSTWAASGVARAAGADEPPTVGVLPTQFSGPIEANARTSMDDGLRTGLADAGKAIKPVELGDFRDEHGRACVELRCAADAAQALGIDALVQLSVQADARNYGLVFTVTRGGAPVSVQASCEICGFEEVARVIEDESRELGRGLGEPLDPGRLRLTSDPPGAEIRVDGRSVGTTPAELRLKPGGHLLTLHLAGHAVLETRVSTLANSTQELAIPLNSLATPKSPRSLPWRGHVGWTLIGVGGASLVGGAVALAFHHRPAGDRCQDSGAIDDSGTCRWRYNQLPVAIPLLALGASAVALGAILAAVGKKRRARASDTLGVSLSPGTVGLLGRF
jgi:hypothetical protein